MKYETTITSAVEAGVSGSDLVTFDKKLLRFGGEHVVEPKAKS